VLIVLTRRLFGVHYRPRENVFRRLRATLMASRALNKAATEHQASIKTSSSTTAKGKQKKEVVHF
jgi:hypothetical protein